MSPPVAAPPPLDDFTVFCRGVRSIADVDLLQYRRGQMERRVRSFADRRGGGDLVSYLRMLRRDPAEVDAFLDRVTINVSQLWRNPEQWAVLAGQVLPELAAGGRVRAWSAGCSYGAEAYTLAATCRTAVPDARVEVIGTDIDRRVVERARAGRFSQDDARDAPDVALRRWFTAVDDELQVSEELRRVCRFEVGDLLRQPARPNRYDLVLCRNTVIYFTGSVRDALHARLAASLRPGGYLVVGATERVTDPRALGLSSTRPFSYRKED
jgi:chemotaxis protein methyltransferase CheR